MKLMGFRAKPVLSLLSFLSFLGVSSARAEIGGCGGYPACTVTTHCSTQCCRGGNKLSYGYFCMFGTVCSPLTHRCEKALPIAPGASGTPEAAAPSGNEKAPPKSE